MNGFNPSIKSTDYRVGKMTTLDALHPYDHHSNTTSVHDSLNGLDIGEQPMAAENPGNAKRPWPYGRYFAPNSGNYQHYESFKHVLGLESLVGNPNTEHAYQNGFVPFQQQEKAQTQEMYNNSERFLEMEKLVLDILSTKDRCTIYDIQKSLPAVTPPKCVSTTMANLEKKGLVDVVENQPFTWTKANPNHLDVKQSLNVCSPHKMYGTTSAFLSDKTTLPDFMYEQTISKGESRYRENENGFANTSSCLNRSVSSPSFEKICPGGFPKPLTRKMSEPTPNAFSKRSPRQRKNGMMWISSVSEDGHQSGSLHGLNVQSLEINLHSLQIAKEAEVGRASNGRLSLQDLRAPTKQVKPKYSAPSFIPRRDLGVIGGERNNKPNSRSKSFEDTWLPRRRLSSSEYDRQKDVGRQRSRSFDCDGDTMSCGLCKISFASKQLSEEHFLSTKHRNKIAKVTSDPYPKFCDYCKVGLNSKSQANEHFASVRHEQTVAKSQKAPIRNHPPLKTPTENFNPVIFTGTKPYGYQVELYCKAITTNSVCFLPIGTGKTLVAALTVAHLLQMNPSRQIIFLVDRVLLVLQQSDYLKRELRNVQIPVSAKDEEPDVGLSFIGQYSNPGLPSLRPLRIGAICGEMRKLEQGIPVFNHDILVVTADCYRNHVSNGTLRFEDSAMIVLDESHHCNKDHPYNVIIRDYYLPDEITLFHRPKILGLTASPAGESTLDRTVKKMQRLLSNLGGASLLTVSDQLQELTEKTSQDEIVCRYAEYTPTEKTLLGLLMEHATKCFNLAARVSEFKEYKEVFQPSSGGVLSKDDIYPILGVIDKLVSSKQKTNPVHSLLHFQIVCDSICTLQECGEKVACDRMLELRYRDCPYGFDWILDQGLPCDNIRSYLEQCSIGACRKDDMGSGVAELLELLIMKMEWVEEEDDEDCYKPLALVLVKRRWTAESLAEYLDLCPRLRARGVRTTCIVEHEARGTNRGMTITQQRETLSNIQEGVFHVIVATNASEDSLDLPSCKLVVQMDPPNSVTALVQIRAYARDSKTSFAAICREKDLAKKIKDLLLRENNMIHAAQIINGDRMKKKCEECDVFDPIEFQDFSS